MAIDPSISLNAKAPSLDATLAPLSSIMQFQTQAQALKKARATYDSDVSQRQSEASLAKTSADIAQQTAPAEIQRLQAAGQQALLSLNDNQRQAVGTFITSQAGNDYKTVITKLNALGEFQPQLKPAIDYMIAAHLQPVANDPKAFADTVKKVGLGTMTVPEQFQARTAQGQMVSNNQQAALVNQNPAADVPVGQVAPGTAVQMQLPPTTPTFNQGTNAPGYYGAGGQGGPQSAPALGVQQQIEQNQGDIKAIRDAGDQAPVQRNINQSILRLSKDTASGPGSNTWHQALGAVSLGNFGDNYQELGKYLEKNAIANMSAMGGSPSDARLQAAAAANGSTSYNPGALQEVTKYNDATTTAIDKFRQGVDKAVGLRNQDPNALPEFKAAWAKNLDPNVFRVENAIRDGDQAELQRLKKELGPPGLKGLAKKRAALESLSATGRLP